MAENGLDELEGHINAPDASGRALLYQTKERIRVILGVGGRAFG